MRQLFQRLHPTQEDEIATPSHPNGGSYKGAAWPERRAFRTCPLCEATCGLEIRLAGDTPVSVRGDRDDVFSHGFICPKGVSLGQLHTDPDRLRAPQLREGDGSFRDAGWDEAFAAVEQGLAPIISRHGRDAIAYYRGNPSAHSLGSLLYSRFLGQGLGTRNLYTASTVDQMPKHVSCGLMFGDPALMPVPDIDRTDHLLILGANPMASNGSILTAPDIRRRLRAIRARGGKIVVVDPRRTRTAVEADEHHPIRPGTDALLLFALVRVMRDERLIAPGDHLMERVNGMEQVLALAEPFSPRKVAPICGLGPKAIEEMARDLAVAPRAAVYGRMGTTTQRFGTLTSWLIDVLNVLSGNLDRPGGAMWTTPAAGQRRAGGLRAESGAWRMGAFASRVSGRPEVRGELPVVCLAEEIETPGPGQVRGLVTLAGNLARSTPNSARMERALGQLDFMVSIDLYRNETTRHANVILPPPSPLERSHYDVALYGYACRNVANYSPPVLERDPETPDEWQTLLRVAAIAEGRGARADVGAIDDRIARQAVAAAVDDQSSPIHGRDVEEICAALAPRRGPERLLDLMIRTGPYGDGFGAGDRSNGRALSLAVLEQHPHGVDLGPLESRLPGLLRTASGRIELAPEPIARDVARLRAVLERRGEGELVLVGRRHLRSNNSWMHNLPLLVDGPQRCTVHVNPQDAARYGLVDGDLASVRSRVGEISLPVEITDDVPPGVVCIPHGWGHGAEGASLGVAAARPGANVNLLTDDKLVDPPSGNAALNGVPVSLAPAPRA